MLFNTLTPPRPASLNCFLNLLQDYARLPKAVTKELSLNGLGLLAVVSGLFLNSGLLEALCH